MAFKYNNNEPEDELIISYQVPLEPCPEGRHPIICVDIFKADPEEQTYDGATKLYEKVMFVFQAFPESGERDSEGKPFQVERKFTWSLAPEGHLRPFLESWRGRDFTKEELQSFDLKAVKGAQAWGTIVHNTRWVNIEAIEPYKDDDGLNLPPLQAGAYTRRNYKKKDKAQTVTAQAAQSVSSSQATSDLVPF
jgi:hypothetical protein